MANKSDELEVTGVSRSGRVRKKSSKLMDFESPEETEIRPKKANQTPKPVKLKPGKSPTVPPLSINLLKKQAQYSGYEDDYSDENSDFGGALSKSEFYDDDFDQNTSLGEEVLQKSNSPSKAEYKSDYFDEEEEESIEDLSDTETSENFSDMPSSISNRDQHSHGQMNSSLYLTEKSKKKMTIKDGKLVLSRQKTQRKDKGKSRITAYMVWAKEMRPVVSHQNPDMDFAAVSKRLGELWSNVSKAERMTWRTRALRLANKAAVTKGGMISTGAPKAKPKESPTRTKTTAASPKRVAANQQNKGRSRTASGSTTSTQARQILSGSDGFDNITGSEAFDSSLSLSSPPTIPPSSRTGEMEPLDVASHLHLLGESLSVIGTRLKEHEGQIAVSGSLSVLLDSVLCALGPLLCLTRLLPETNGCPPETLSRILDNIAYLMPGL